MDPHFLGGVRNYQGGRVANNRGEGHEFLCFEKGRVAIFSAVTSGRVMTFHVII